MNSNNEDRGGEKLSMGLSICIALCVITLFCIISIVIAKNIDRMSKEPSIDSLNSQTDNIIL